MGNSQNKIDCHANVINGEKGNWVLVAEIENTGNEYTMFGQDLQSGQVVVVKLLYNSERFKNEVEYLIKFQGYPNVV